MLRRVLPSHRLVSIAFTVGLALSLSVTSFAETPARAAALPEDLDEWVARALVTFEVPGLALAVVRDGETLVAKGYGVREQGKDEPVDASTLFPIASNTKVFTATALGILIDEGRLAWDVPVIDHLPWFRLGDPYVTSELTIRDLLVHRSGLGLGQGDLLWWPPTTYSRREVAERLRFLEPVTSFRSAYAYDNVLYLVAGEVIEAVSGSSWEEFVRTRILEPVGMSESSPRLSTMKEPGNVAAPHAPIDGSVRRIRPFSEDQVDPAGGIVSNARDMAKWLRVLLSDGSLAEDRRLVRLSTARELSTLVTPIPVGEPPPELARLRANFRGYALGLGVSDYQGRKLVTHTGGLPGYVSRVIWVPEERVGVAVLTNQESGAAFDSVAFRIVDHVLGLEPYDWIEAWSAVVARNEARTRTFLEQGAAQRDAMSRPSLPLDAYAGTFADAWYGDIEIARAEDGLTIRFTRTPVLVGSLEHWQHDTFVARWHDRELRADAFVTFSLTPEGAIERAKMRAVSPATDFSFDFHDLELVPRPGAR